VAELLLAGMVAAAGEAAEELAELRQRELRDQWAPLLRSPLEDVDATAADRRPAGAATGAACRGPVGRHRLVGPV